MSDLLLRGGRLWQRDERIARNPRWRDAMGPGANSAVAGAAGAVGQAALKALEGRQSPVKTLRAFATERLVAKRRAK
jgi:hypothetical protein